MSIKPQDTADSKQRKRWGWSCLLNFQPVLLSHCSHCSQLSRISTSSSTGEEAQPARAHWDGRSSQELLCLSCSVVHCQFLQPFPISSTPGKIGWVFPAALALSWEEQQCSGWGGEGGGSWKAALYPVHTQQFVTVKNHLFLGITILRGEIIASVQHKTSI